MGAEFFFVGRGVSEIPLLLILLYFGCETARSEVASFWCPTVCAQLSSCVRAGAACPTHLGGEFGWGGTSSTRQRRCPKMSSVRTEISRSAKG